jgi:hypothetical protein
MCLSVQGTTLYTTSKDLKVNRYHLKIIEGQKSEVLAS